MPGRTVIRTEIHQTKNEVLWQLCRDAKNLYNRSLYLINEHYREKQEYLGYRALYELIRGEDCYKKLASQAAQSVLRRLDKNWQSFFALRRKEMQSMPPRYRKKNGHFVWEYAGSKVSIRNGVLTIPRTDIKISTRVKDRIVWLRVVPKNDRVCVEISYEKKIEIDHVKTGRTVGIDLGVNNLAAIASDGDDRSCLVNGRPLKSMNQYYNKRLVQLRSACRVTSGNCTSKRIAALSRKRNNKINDYMHKASRAIVDHCRSIGADRIVIGKNVGWKQGCNIGRVNNQSFCGLPTARLIEMVSYKAEELGMEVVTHEESYTSKTDHLLMEEMGHLDRRSGRRVSRGLFRSGSGIVLNADVNGAYGMLRKKNVVDGRFFELIVDRGHVVWPARLNVKR